MVCCFTFVAYSKIINMATIYFSLSAKTNIDKKCEVLIRFSHGKINRRAKTNIFIPAEYWDTKSQQITVPNFRLMTEEKKQLKSYLTTQNEKLNAVTATVQAAFNDADKNDMPQDWLKLLIDKYNFPEKYAAKIDESDRIQPFFEAFDEFLQKRKLSDAREKNFMVLKRALQRYELFVSVNEGRDFKLELDTVTGDTIEDFESFLRNEYELYNEYKAIYDKFPAITNTNRKTSTPQPRGMNTINALFNKLRAFFNWCLDNEKMTNRPFKNYESKPDLYGTPYYISIEERNRLYHTDLSHRPALETQRDIFIFQCVIGCRVADLYKFTKQNIINGSVEYIARKTKDDRPITVRVPLNSIAREILAKYTGFDGGNTVAVHIRSEIQRCDQRNVYDSGTYPPRRNA